MSDQVRVDADDADDTIDDIVDSFFDAREAIFEHVGYVEDWRVLPLDDSRDQFWAVDAHEREWVKFSPSREALVYWLEHDDYGSHGDKLYENAIYTQRHLTKWVFRGEELTLAVTDTNTDGNKYLQLFRNENEVRLGVTASQPAELSQAQPADPPPAQIHPLNQAIGAMIEADQKACVDGQLVKVRAMCAAVSPADLKAAISEHCANCHEPNCAVLAAMEVAVDGVS